MQKIINKFSKHATKEEVTQFVKEAINKMVSTAKDKGYGDYLLVGGDISYNYNISRIFYTELAKQWNSKKIIVVLGNHELWDAHIDENDNLIFSGDALPVTIEKYRNLFEGLNINFLHNQLLVLDEKIKGITRISSEEQILNISDKKLKDIALKSSFVVLGGLGFSGYENRYNATVGLYRNKVMTLEEDIKETEKFEKIYDKIKSTIPNDKVIVLTHTPKSNWSKDGYNPNWIYVNGHTHKNEYTINAEKTVYSDNQIGYKSISFGLKSFNVSGIYNVFRHYEDGKHIITKSMYDDFNHGMKIDCTFNSADGVIHMLKKDNNYCFFYEEKNKLYLLNGGRKRKIKHQNLDYYFESLDVYSSAIKNILYKYNIALKQISNEVKKFGGEGKIHGCIVDIDFYNHICLNPIDGTISAYNAKNMRDKILYPSVEELLKTQRKDLYSKCMKVLLKDNSILMKTKIYDETEIGLCQYVFGTEMYKPSRIIRSLQYITEANIIRTWNDDIIDKIKSELLENKLYLD